MNRRKMAINSLFKVLMPSRHRLQLPVARVLAGAISYNDSLPWWKRRRQRHIALDEALDVYFEYLQLEGSNAIPDPEQQEPTSST